MSVTIATEQYGEWILLRVAGDIDLVSGAVVRDHVHQEVAEGRRRLVLDLSGVRFCDSSGVGVLIAARRLLRSCAGELRLVLPDAGSEASTDGTPRLPSGGHVHRVFTALGVRRLFDIHPDVRSATGRPAVPAQADRADRPLAV